jgi:hypothetical protein
MYARRMSAGRLLPAEAVLLIGAELARGDWDFALRLTFQTIAAVSVASEIDLPDLIAEEPAWCDDERFNVLVATGVAWALERRELRVPPWTDRAPLAEDWIVWGDEHGPSETWAARIANSEAPPAPVDSFIAGSR